MPGMNILIAPDSFKDCLSAMEVAAALERGISRVWPEVSCTLVPLADGGEGTVESVIDATGGKKISLRVHDPLMREVDSFYGITGDEETAVIEMASASGIELLKPVERDPWITTTFGTGQLIRDALDRGAKKILLGIGGSATNDGGAGMAQALGVRFLGRFGPINVQGGGALAEVQEIQMDALDARIKNTEIIVACDVDNPLIGPQGASAVYGPQKGADEQLVESLDKNLVHFAALMGDQLGKTVANMPGAGAAGGLGAGPGGGRSARGTSSVP